MTSDEKDKIITTLEQEIARLRADNRKLEETVQWMHDLIWKMVKEREEQKTKKTGSNENTKEM